MKINNVSSINFGKLKVADNLQTKKELNKILTGFGGCSELSHQETLKAFEKAVDTIDNMTGKEEYTLYAKPSSFSGKQLCITDLYIKKNNSKQPEFNFMFFSGCSDLIPAIKAIPEKFAEYLSWQK